MSYFFQGFPTILYDAYGNKKPVETTDIYRAVRIKVAMRDDVLLYKTYHIQEGERPDHVSLKMYGTIDYYWTFFMINENLVNVYSDWPLSRLELENRTALKYPGEVLTINDIVQHEQSTPIRTLTSESSTIIQVISTSGFPSSGILKLGNSPFEFVSYTGKTATSFLGCTRGVAGGEYWDIAEIPFPIEHPIGQWVTAIWEDTQILATSFLKNEVVRGILSGTTANITEKDPDTGVIRITNVVGQGFIDGELIQGQTSGHMIIINGQRLYKEVPHHFEQVDGTIVSKNVEFALPITNEEFERSKNDELSVIRVIRPEYIGRLSTEFFSQINPEEE